VVLTSMPNYFTGKRTLVTGATGFIGRHLVATLLERGCSVRALARDKDKARAIWADNSVAVNQGDLAQPATLENICAGINIVFHLASCNYAEDSSGGEAEKLHQEITVQGTRCLLEAAVRAGVKEFIFISSVKAMGEGSRDCLDETSPPVPETAYGRAKLAAERIVTETGSKYAMHICNLRLPMVYGLDNAGNLPRMIAAVERGWFPALPAVGNRRSMVHVNDVIQAILLAAEKAQARNQTYIITDGRVYSTSQIYDLIRQALGRPIPRWRVPALILRAGASVGDLAEWFWGSSAFFNSASLHKLMGSAWYSSDKIQQELGYTPQYSLEGALPEMIREQIS
jgi:UDP-glucose 4-epimerase